MISLEVQEPYPTISRCASELIFCSFLSVMLSPVWCHGLRKRPRDQECVREEGLQYTL